MGSQHRNEESRQKYHKHQDYHLYSDIQKGSRHTITNRQTARQDECQEPQPHKDPWGICKKRRVFTQRTKKGNSRAGRAPRTTTTPEEMMKKTSYTEDKDKSKDLAIRYSHKDLEQYKRGVK